MMFSPEFFETEEEKQAYEDHYNAVLAENNARLEAILNENNA